VPVIGNEPNFLNRTRSLSSTEDHSFSFVCIPILQGRKVLEAISVELLGFDVEILGIIASMIA
jgi:Nif-specific regulatory protein